MKKIAGVFLLALAVLVSFHPAGAQPAPKMPRIGFLSHVPLSKLSIRIKAFRQGLRDLGYVEGRSITIVYRSMEGPNDRLSKLAVDLVRQKVDVILAVAQPAPDAALKATRTIPIVVAVGANTVVANLNRPGGNVTGLTSMASDLVGKQLELFKEALPGLSRMAVLWNPNHRGHPRGVQRAEQAARALGLRLVVIGVRSPAGFPVAFRRMKAEGVDGALILRGGLFVSNRTRIVELASKAALPTMFGHPVEAQAGGLMSYGTDNQAIFRRAATYVVKILKGAKPAELPIEQPTKFNLVINLKTAKQLGITISPEVLYQATKVIK